MADGPAVAKKVVRSFSIPPDLLERMSKAAGDVALSRWACRAFEEKLARDGGTESPVAVASRSRQVEPPATRMSDDERVAMATGVSVAAQEALEAHRSDPIEFVPPPPIEPTSPVSPRDLERHLATPRSRRPVGEPQSQPPPTRRPLSSEDPEEPPFKAEH